MGTGVQIFEAIVTNAAPDADMPGFIKVKIPELFGDDELPCLVGPIHPGWTAGGWQSVPAATLPASDTDEENVRVIVVKLAPYVYRYMGTTQGWSTIEGSPGTICGVRSPDDKHTILMDTDGLRFSGFEDESIVNMLTGEVRVSSPKIRFTTAADGSATTEPLILGTTFLTDLATFLQACIADAAMSPGVAAGATTWLVQVQAALAAKAPYLSATVETV